MYTCKHHFTLPVIVFHYPWMIEIENRKFTKRGHIIYWIKSTHCDSLDLYCKCLGTKMETMNLEKEYLFMKYTCKSTCHGGKHDALFLQKSVIRNKWKLTPIWQVKYGYHTSTWPSNGQGDSNHQIVVCVGPIRDT